MFITPLCKLYYFKSGNILKTVWLHRQNKAEPGSDLLLSAAEYRIDAKCRRSQNVAKQFLYLIDKLKKKENYMFCFKVKQQIIS